MRKNNRGNSFEDRRKRVRGRKKKKNVFFRLFLLLIIFLLVIISVVYIYKKFIKSNTEERINQAQDLNTSKIEENSYRDSIKNKTIEDLDKLIKKYIKDNNLDINKINLLFNIPNKNINYVLREKDNILMRNNNTFIISMLVEDLYNQGLLDLSERIELVKEDSNTKISVTLGNLLKEIIISPDEDKLETLTNKLELAINTDWKTYANNLYNINIDNENYMTYKDLNIILQKLISKDENKYLYNNTINLMLESANNKKYLQNYLKNNYLGMQSEISYNYIIENAIVLDRDDYVYSIFGEYSDSSILDGLREIILEFSKESN